MKGKVASPSNQSSQAQAGIAGCELVEESLREQETKFKEAQRLALIGYWERDFIADQITWSEETCRIFGLQPQQRTLNQAELQQLIYPDDRQLQIEALNQTLHGDHPYDVEYRIIRPDGEIRFVHIRDDVKRDELGRPIRAFGIVQDITDRKRAEELLHAQEQEIKAIVENSPDLIIRFDRNLGLIYVNPAFVKISGISKEALLGNQFGSVIQEGAVNVTAEDVGIISESLKRVFDTGRPIDFEATWPLSIGRKSYAVHLEPEFNTRGVLTSVLSISRDITKLKESEEQFRTLVTFSPDALYLQVDDRITLVNPAMCKLLGADEPTQLLGKSIFDIIHPDFHSLIRKRLEAVFEGRPAEPIEETFVRIDGSSVKVEANAVLVEFRGCKEVLVIARDITLREQAEKHIRHLNRVYAVLSNINHTIVREKDTQKLFESSCRIAIEKGSFQMAWIGLLDPVSHTIKLAASAGANHNTLDLLNAILSDERHHCGCVFTLQALQTGQPKVCNDIEHDPQTESWRDIALQRNYRAMASLPLKTGDKIVGTFNLYAGDSNFFDAEELRLLDELATDISFAMEVHQHEVERQCIEDELRWKTAFLEAQVHSALDGIMVVDSRGKIILRNQQLAEMWKLPPQIIGNHDDATNLQFAINQTRYPIQFAEKVAYLYAHPDETSRDEIELVDGRVFDRYSAPVLDRIGSQYGRIWTFRDITKGKKAEAALRLSEAQLRATFEGAALGIALVNLEGRSVKCNPALTRILGYSESELCRLTFSEFTHPEDVEIDMRLYRSLLEGERDNYEIEKRYVRKDGQIVWGRLNVSLVKQAEGIPPLAIGMIEDITARRQLEEQFRQVQKMEAIGQLAGGVAHDFNNILAIIQLQSGLLGADPSLSAAQREVCNEIVLASERAARLTRQLLMFSRKQTMQLANLNLNEVVAQMTKMLQRILGEDISLSANYAPNLPLILADMGMIEQILLNLAVNSRDAMPHGGKLIITTGIENLNSIQAGQNTNTPPGLYVRLSVSDTGCGIPQEILPRIFEPFFTTKEVGKGTGLGLATVYGIVQQHRGRINLTTEINLGTTFHIYFPAVLDASTDKKDKFILAELSRGTETILLVEDEPALRATVSNSLQHCGYNVLRAESGVAALKIWQEHKDEIQLLLTDIIMPDGITGYDLARRLQAEKPQLKVIYTSGYSGDLVNQYTSLVEGFNFLQKPFKPRMLAETLRKNLDPK